MLKVKKIMILKRSDIEKRERETLAPYAALSACSKGRLINEDECEFRTAFQRDRDRITHSKAFRRLKHKTQVFLAPTGDHYRTRLTHTLEVAQIARAIGRSLRLNEDLIEAISLGHDLGHTPFGHAGEEVLNDIYEKGFSHQEHSIRVIDHLAKDGKGLNLTWEVRDGILRHSKGRKDIISSDISEMAKTAEGRVVRVCDIIAYIAHDLDDAMRGGVITNDDIPVHCLGILGERTSSRIGTMVKDLIINSDIDGKEARLAFSGEVLDAMLDLREFLYEQVYNAESLHKDSDRSTKVIKELYEIFMLENQIFESEIDICPADTSERARLVVDFIAGMTDQYALELYQKIFLPRPWTGQ
jgi:dGTPase